LRVLGFGTYDLATHPRPGVILDGFRCYGDDVVEINEPLGFSTVERVAMLGRPWLAYRLVLRLLVRWASLIRRSRLERGVRFDAVIVGYLGQFDVVLARLLYRRSRIVLDLMIFAVDTARDRGTSRGLKLRVLAALDGLAVHCADVVVLDTEEQLELLPERARHKTVIVPVGASADWFAAADNGAPRASPGLLSVVFFGVYTPLQGAVVIGQALARLAERRDITVTMIGSGQDYPATREAAQANTQITWLEWLEAEDLVRLVAAHDVCLGIFGDSPKAQRVVPNKVFQGAAAGCAIVTSDTAPQRRMLDEAALYVPPGDPAALADALTALAADAARTAALQAAARSMAGARFSAESVAGPLRERLLGG